MGRGKGNSPRGILLAGKTRFQLEEESIDYQDLKILITYPNSLVLIDTHTQKEIAKEILFEINVYLNDMEPKFLRDKKSEDKIDYRIFKLAKEVKQDLEAEKITRKTAEKIEIMLTNKWVTTLFANSLGREARPLFIKGNEALVEEDQYDTDWNANRVDSNDSETSRTINLSGDIFRFELIRSLCENLYYNDHRIKNNFLDLSSSALGEKIMLTYTNWEMDFVRLEENGYLEIIDTADDSMGYRFTDKLGRLLPFFYAESHMLAQEVKDLNQQVREANNG